MTTTHMPAVIAVFRDSRQALRAVEALRAAGFRENQIGIAGRDLGSQATDLHTAHVSSAAPGQVIGAVRGAGLGALTGFVVVVLSLPLIGPLWTAGALAVLLGNAAAGGAVGGLLTALVSRGITEAEAHTIESELAAGRTLVSVEADGHPAAAWAILEQHGGVGATNPLHGPEGGAAPPSD